MVFLALASAAVVVAAYAYAQASTPVSQGQPISGNYSGPLRPQIHFSPPTEFMNDPNGMFLDADGVYHLYYQYNPTDIVAGNQHWGHATSNDLFHWTNQQIAIYPPTNDSQLFSGSAVVDVNNTSGFFPNQTNGVVAIYTLNTATAQVQEIAYSSDGGYTFQRYAGNPVIDVNSTQFRDPKVIWHEETGKWAMVVAHSQDFVIEIYTSPDLKEWSHGSNFSHYGLLGSQYECPNMLALPVVRADGTSETMYLLAISINPGAPLGGSITQYFPGTFNGTHFTPADGATRLTDFGKDNYAGQFFSGVPASQKQIAIGWASNWQYAQTVPTGPLEGWRSAMTLPKISSLRDAGAAGIELVQELPDLSPIYESQLVQNRSTDNLTLAIDYSSVSSGTIYLDINVTNINMAAVSGTLNFTITSSSTNESLSAGYLLSSGDFWIDRGDVEGFKNLFFTDRFFTVYAVQNGAWRLQAVVDRSLLEVAIDSGRQAATTSFYPQVGGKMDGLLVAADGLGQAEVSVGVWGLQSGWAAEASQDGLVYGNVTSSS
ncbi:hypothetical protein OE88DRAFT_1656123 [Heliocybe sulcata]|uniref:Glycoside hydrolase family 32 protein n=1 Tax=Heliocybe sulcata TaxID=5364 RepID=A0A5C3NJL4_9AGAM|nr:hypothetical protein OE88DRAFT_1656123 [Heliocybe sulcata]